MAASVGAKKPRKYRKNSCHTTITAAKAAAKKLRASGMTASVRGKCVYSAGKSKGVFGRGVSGTRKRRASKRK